MSLNARIWGPAVAAGEPRALGAGGQHVLSRSYSYSAAFAAACRDWDLALCQLDRGIFRGKLMQLILPQLHLSRFRANRSLEHLGRGPQGMRTLIVPADREQRFTWFGQRVDDGQVLLLPTDTAVFAVTPPGLDIFTVSVCEPVLDAWLRDGDRRRLQREFASGDACIFAVPGIANLRTRLHRLHARLTRGGDRPLPAVRGDDLLAQILQPLLAATLVSPRPLRRRDRALIAARRLILEHDAEDITVQDLCDAGQVSERTLQYAFFEHYGLNPKRYLVVYRLNCVRDDLLRLGDRELKIADVANRWGFWHLGGFAADYRALFGELPSESLQNARRRSGGDPRPTTAANPCLDLAGWVATPFRSWSLQ